MKENGLEGHPLIYVDNERDRPSITITYYATLGYVRIQAGRYEEIEIRWPARFWPRMEAILNTQARPIVRVSSSGLVKLHGGQSKSRSKKKRYRRRL